MNTAHRWTPSFQQNRRVVAAGRIVAFSLLLLATGFLYKPAPLHFSKYRQIKKIALAKIGFLTNGLHRFCTKVIRPRGPISSVLETLSRIHRAPLYRTITLSRMMPIYIRRTCSLFTNVIPTDHPATQLLWVRAKNSVANVVF